MYLFNAGVRCRRHLVDSEIHASQGAYGGLPNRAIYRGYLAYLYIYRKQKSRMSSVPNLSQLLRLTSPECVME